VGRRPLSIPDVACRVWGSILNQRLLDATKDILPDTMFGFRPGRRTADPLLVLRHMIDMNRASVGTKFGVAFMDLSAAYDSIDRDLLFAKLKHRGMSDHSINTLKHLYQTATCIVKCDQPGWICSLQCEDRPAAGMSSEHDAVQPVHLGLAPAPDLRCAGCTSDDAW
jgi:hypothetical protein